MSIVHIDHVGNTYRPRTDWRADVPKNDLSLWASSIIWVGPDGQDYMQRIDGTMVPDFTYERVKSGRTA